MPAFRKCNKVPREVKNGISHVEDWIIKIGKILHMLQFSGMRGPAAIAKTKQAHLLLAVQFQAGPQL